MTFDPYHPLCHVTDSLFIFCVWGTNNTQHLIDIYEAVNPLKVVSLVNTYKEKPSLNRPSNSTSTVFGKFGIRRPELVS